MSKLFIVILLNFASFLAIYLPLIIVIKLVTKPGSDQWHADLSMITALTFMPRFKVVKYQSGEKIVREWIISKSKKDSI
jgi:hypothetical protein